MKDILLRLIDLPEAERLVALDQACAGDPELRADVEDLLAHDPQGSGGRGSDDLTGDRGLIARKVREGLSTLQPRHVERASLPSASPDPALASPNPSPPISSPPASSDGTTLLSPPTDRFAPGQILGNRYRILNLTPPG